MEAGDQLSLTTKIPDSSGMQNKEPDDDTSQHSYNYSKSPSFEKESVKDNSVNGFVASVKHDDGEIEKSANGSSSSLKNDADKENFIHSSKTSLKHDDGEIEKSVNGSSASLQNDAQKEKSINGSSTSLKHSDCEVDKSINGSAVSLKSGGDFNDEENEKKSLNDSALDTTNPDQTYRETMHDTDSAVGDTKSLNGSNHDKTSIKSDCADGILKLEDETASVRSNQSDNNQEDALKLAEDTDGEQQPVVFLTNKNDSDDNKSEKSVLDDNVERGSLKSAGTMSVSSKRSENRDSAIVGAAAALTLTTGDEKDAENSDKNDDDIVDDKSVSSGDKKVSEDTGEIEKASVKEQSIEGSNGGSVKNVAAAVTIASLQRSEKTEDNNDADIDKASVETESLGDEQVTGETKKLSDKDSDIDKDDDDDNDEDNNADDDDNINETGGFVYDLFDSSSDDETKKEKVDDGPAYPTYTEDFDSLHFHDEVLRGIYALGLEKPNDVQSKCLPHALKWKDCVIQAPTGSGKTTMYISSSLNLLPRTTNKASTKSGVRVLVICPTRESCHSVSSQFEQISKFMPNVSIVTLAGGGDPKQDKTNLRRRRPNIVIGTPSKISACIREDRLGLSQLKVLIFENSDMMTKTKEFKTAVYHIFRTSPKKKQVIFTTATPTPEMKPYMKEPFEILTENNNLISQSLDQYYANVVGVDEKKQNLCKILEQVTYKQCIIFATSPENCDDIVKFLQEKEIPAAALYSDIGELDTRLENYANFSDQKIRVLVTTDVLSRVTVSSNVNLVVNYDMPACDLSVLVHRVTKAVPVYATSSGIAISFLESSNVELFQQAEKKYGFTAKELPSNLAEVAMPDETTANANNASESVEQESDEREQVLHEENNKDEDNINQTQQETTGGEDTVSQKDKHESNSITHTPSQEQEVDQNDKQSETTNVPLAASSQQQEMNQSNTSLKDSKPSSRQQSANSSRHHTTKRRDSKLSIVSVKSNQKDKTRVCTIL